jgi:hypothetical protein
MGESALKSPVTSGFTRLMMVSRYFIQAPIRRPTQLQTAARVPQIDQKETRDCMSVQVLVVTSALDPL